jgi:predicted Zn-dependent protease
MLRRARKLRDYFDQYCRDHDYTQFRISDVEWRQIDYLLQLTKPFFQFMMALMKTRDVTIHSVFLVYRSS